MSAHVLITGATGFAGRHLLAACLTAGDEVAIVSRSSAAAGIDGADVHVADLLDPDATREAVAAAAPDVVYHLAALASVARSWEEPAAALAGNVASTLNLLEAVRGEAPRARVVVAGSGEVYGPPERLPVDEEAPLRPQNPYAVSKAAADLLAGMYADAYGLHVIRARAFNHAGPGQGPTFAIASFARQVAAGEMAGDRPIRVVSGNPDARRDFTDVRDVVRAYRLLAERAEPGVYNVCSGGSISVGEVIALLGGTVNAEVEHVVDPALVRPHDVAEIRGSHERLTGATGWEPEVPLERTLADAVAWWRETLAAETAPRGA